jgi:hypothetical protein
MKPPSGDPGFGLRILTTYAGEHANAPHSLLLLCVCRQRPKDHRTAKKCDELASPHVALEARTVHRSASDAQIGSEGAALGQ